MCEFRELENTKYEYNMSFSAVHHFNVVANNRLMGSEANNGYNDKGGGKNQV